ncbi:hypothetical protein D3C73_1210720 [compost metagenome]
MVGHLGNQINNLLRLLWILKHQAPSVKFIHQPLQRQLHGAAKLNVVDQIIDHFNVFSHVRQNIIFQRHKLRRYFEITVIRIFKQLAFTGNILRLALSLIQ